MAATDRPGYSGDMADHTGAGPVPALIFGTHITALGVLRVLTRRGVPCHGAEQTSDIIVRSRWYRPAARRLSETDDPAVLADYLRSLPDERAVLIACSDRWTTAVAGLPADVRARFPASVPPPDAVAQFVDKGRFLPLVERLGIPHPRTHLIRSPADLDAVSDADLENGFLKPVESSRFYVRFGTKGFFVRSRDQAAELVDLAARDGITFLIQEWVPGPVPNTILLDGLVDRTGRIAAIGARRRLRMDPPRLANTTLDVTIPLAKVDEAVGHVRRLLAEVRYRGVFNIEFKQDERDGSFRIIEVNARPYWLIAHTASAGMDLPWLAYLDALGLPVPEATVRVGRYGMYEVPEISALARAWVRGRRPEGPIVAPWLRGDHTLLWASDPLPGAFDLARATRRRAGDGVARAVAAVRRAVAHPRVSPGRGAT